MAFLREAVEKQKDFLIHSLIKNGMDPSNTDELYNKTITELINEYDEFTIKINKSTNNALKFTRRIEWTEKPKAN